MVSQFPNSSRGLKILSFALVPCSSLLIPAIIPLNLFLVKIFFKPLVFLAADLAAGGNEGSILLRGGQVPFIRFTFHFFTNFLVPSGAIASILITFDSNNLTTDSTKLFVILLSTGIPPIDLKKKEVKGLNSSFFPINFILKPKYDLINIAITKSNDFE